METIRIIETYEKEKEYDMNFAMLLSYVRSNRILTGGNSVIIMVGVWKCRFEVLPENFDGDDE